MKNYSVAPAFAQMTIKPDSPMYNVGYDSLMRTAERGVANVKLLGPNSAKLYIMFATRAIEVNPDEVKGYEVRGQLYLLGNDLDNADKDFNKAIDMVPTSFPAVEGLYQLIVKKAEAYAIKEVPKQMAMEVFKRSQAFIKAAPSELADAKTQALTKGYIYKLQAESPEAMKLYVDAINTDSALAIGNFEAALPLVEKTDTPVMTALVLQGAGSKHFLMKDFPKAKAAYQKAIATKACDGISYQNLAIILDEQEKKPAEAEKLSMAGLKVLPENPEISEFLAGFYLKRGKAAVDKKDNAGAVKELEKYQIYLPNESRGALYLALAYFNTKEYGKAAVQLKKAKLFCDSVEYAYLVPNAGEVIDFGEKKTKKAPVFQTLIVENEKSEVLYDKGLALVREGKLDEAIASTQQALAFFEKTNYAVGKAICYNGIGTAYHHKKEYDKAKEYYNKAIAAGARSSSSYTNLAVIVMYGDKDEAAGEKILLEGAEKFPNDRAIAQRLGDLYDGKAYEFYEAKNYASAGTFYEKEVRYNPKAETYVYLGFCYYKTDEKQKCRDAFRQAVEMDESVNEKFSAINQILDQIGR